MVSGEECANISAEALADGILRMLPEPEGGSPLPLYISIDKDVLRAEDADTNWDQGGMRLDRLTECLRIISRSRRIIGCDICGCTREPSAKNLRADLTIIGTMLDIL